MFHAVLGFDAHQSGIVFRLLRRTFALGHEAVAIFIVVSGYCLMLPVVGRDPVKLTLPFASFLRRRAYRILPPYFGAVLSSLALIGAVAPLRRAGSGTVWDSSLPAFDIGALSSHLFLVHNWFPGWEAKINGPLWSVATEWQIYFLFPLLLLPTWRRFGMFATLAIAGLVGYSPLLVAAVSARSAVSWYVLLFGLGMVAAAIGFSPDPSATRWRGRARGPACAAAWLFCAGCATLEAPLWFRFKPITDLFIGFAAAMLLIYLTDCTRAGSRNPLLQILQSHPLVTIGHRSYSIYLTHFPVVALCYFGLSAIGLSTKIITLCFVPLGLLTSLLVGFLFHRYLERPFMNSA